MSTPTQQGFSAHSRHGAHHQLVFGHQFNGSSDYLPLPGGWGGTPELTVEAWINTSDPTGDFQAIVSSNGPEFIHFQAYSAGNITIYTNTGPLILPVIPDTPANVWRHVAVVARPGASRLLIDGEQIGETNRHLYHHILPSRNVSIGRGWQDGRYFNGSIAGLRIWQHSRPHALLHQEVFQYHEQKPPLNEQPDPTHEGFKSYHNKYLSAHPDGTVYADKDWFRGWEKFEVVDAGNGQVGLKSYHGKYLSAQPDGRVECNRDWLRGWEKFRMVIAGPNQVGFKSYHGKYLSAQPDGRLEGNRDWLRGWEKFSPES